MWKPQSTISPEAPIIDPVIQKMLDELGAEGAAPVYTLTPTEARDTLISNSIQAGSKARLPN